MVAKEFRHARDNFPILLFIALSTTAVTITIYSMHHQNNGITTSHWPCVNV